MSIVTIRKFHWLSILVTILMVFAVARGISNVRSLPDSHTISDVFFTMLISGDIPLLIFLIGGLVILISRYLRKQELPVIATVRHYIETQTPFITTRRFRIVGNSSDHRIRVLVQHGIAPPLYSLYEVDSESNVTHCEDFTLLPPELK